MLQQTPRPVEEARRRSAWALKSYGRRRAGQRLRAVQSKAAPAHGGSGQKEQQQDGKVRTRCSLMRVESVLLSTSLHSASPSPA